MKRKSKRLDLPTAVGLLAIGSIAVVAMWLRAKADAAALDRLRNF